MGGGKNDICNMERKDGVLERELGDEGCILMNNSVGRRADVTSVGIKINLG